MRNFLILVLLSLLTTALLRPALAPPPTPPANPMSQTGFDQNLGVTVPADLQLLDERGRSRTFAELQGGKPTLLVLGYYGCPMLCNQIRTGLLDSLKMLDWTAGKEFRVITVSIDPRERAADASRVKETTLRRYDRPMDPDGWRFVTGTPAEIVRLCDVVGFRAKYDRATDQFAHPAGLVILTPQGQVSSYQFGINFPHLALQKGLQKASEEQIGTKIDPLLFLCYHYDPATGRYSLAIMRIVQMAGLATVLILGAVVTLYLRKERKAA